MTEPKREFILGRADQTQTPEWLCDTQSHAEYAYWVHTAAPFVVFRVPKTDLLNHYTFLQPGSMTMPDESDSSMEPKLEIALGSYLGVRPTEDEYSRVFMEFLTRNPFIRGRGGDGTAGPKSSGPNDTLRQRSI